MKIDPYYILLFYRIFFILSSSAKKIFVSQKNLQRKRHDLPVRAAAEVGESIQVDAVRDPLN